MSATDAPPRPRPKRDLAVSARIPRGLRAAVEAAGERYSEQRVASGAEPPRANFNSLVNIALVRFCRDFPPEPAQPVDA